MNWGLLKNSLMVSGLATCFAVALGFLGALWLMTLERRWRTRLLVIVAVALALPPFLVTNCWLKLLGQTGIWHPWIPFNIYSLGGTVWILTSLTWPITTFFTLGAWQRLEPVWLESEPALRGRSLVFLLLAPMARSALVHAAVLTFVLALNNFAVPAILQVKVYPAELWVNFNTTFNYLAALQLSWPLVLAPLVLLIWLKRREIAWPRTASTVSARLFTQQLGRGWHWFSGLATLTTVAWAVLIPFAQLAGNATTWRELPAAFAASHHSFVNSLWYAALAASLCVTLGLLGWRRRIGLLWWILLLVPGVILDIVLIYLLNRPPFIAFYASSGIVILAWTLRYLALGWNGAAHARRGVDRDLIDAARLDGASGWSLFRHILWPQIAPQLAAAWYAIYLLCLWDAETLVLIVPPGGETLALRIFNLLHYGHNSQVDALCLGLLVLAAWPLLLWQISRRASFALTSLMSTHSNAGRDAFHSVPLVFSVCLILPLGLTGCSAPSSLNEASVPSKIFDRVQVIGSRGTGLGQFNKPRSVAVDRQDNLYVVDMTARVQKFDANGVFLSCWQMENTDKGKPKGMDCDSQGNVIVVEPHYSRVNHFSTAGKLVAQWGRNGTNAGQLAFPRSVAVNAHGETYISEYNLAERVQRFTALGQQCLNCFGQAGSGPGEFNRAEGLGVDAEDRVYVADSCNHRIQVFTRAGKFLRAYGQAGSKPGELSYPYDVRIDKAGRQYVCEFGNSRIQIFDAHDKLIEVLGGPGMDPGQFSTPWSIALDSKGNLYVADAGNHRVQKFRARKLS